MARRNYSGFSLEDRAGALAALAARGVLPLFEVVVFEHVTYRYPDSSPAPTPSSVRVVGHAAADGVQAVLVEVDGSSARPSGGLFHVTVSHARDRKPVHSNALLQRAVQDGTLASLDPFELVVTPF